MRYALYTARRQLFSDAVSYSSDGRRFATMQKAADTVTQSMLDDDGPAFIHDTKESGYSKWFKVVGIRQIAGVEVVSLDKPPFDYPLPVNAYYVCDDSAFSVRGRGGVSYHVMYGNPWTAVGAAQDEFDTLSEAVEYMRHHAGDSPMFRVKLERRHGEHSAKEIK